MSNNQLSEETQQLLRDYKKALELEKKYNETEEEKISVHQVSSKIAFFYEKLRNTVDYKEEHLLRKNAVERILKRRIMTEKNEADVSKFLVYELIRARYLPNKKIPKSRIGEIERIIEKYTFLLNRVPDQNANIGAKESLFDWVIGIASYEIEEKLVPHNKDNAIVDFARGVIIKKVEVDEDLHINSELEQELVYIAVLKNLIKCDVAMIRYKLFMTKHSEWVIAPSEETISRLALVMNSVAREIDKSISHEYSENFSGAVKKNLAYFTILQEVASDHPKEIEYIFSHHFHIEDSIKETCVKKYRSARTKLSRAAVRSIIYIFITKVALALIIELPFDKYIIGRINYFTLAVNILFPPILMALVVLTIKVPSKKNTDFIVGGIKDIIYGEYKNSPIVIKRTVVRNSLFSGVFKILYLIVFLVSFGAIIFILEHLGFNLVSITLFIFFLSVVSYFGIRIRQNARELVVVQKKEGVMSFITDLFSIPILQVGQWLSTKMSNLNVFVYVLDFIIEAPFKTFLDIFEEWIYYIKEEKDKIK
ncbi:MAG: hypothetical protein WC178_01880 [Candidatus Paceibacterota bacterium]